MITPLDFTRTYTKQGSIHKLTPTQVLFRVAASWWYKHNIQTKEKQRSQ